jgi:hypothetical protein
MSEDYDIKEQKVGKGYYRSKVGNKYAKEVETACACGSTSVKKRPGYTICSNCHKVRFYGRI